MTNKLSEFAQLIEAAAKEKREREARELSESIELEKKNAEAEAIRKSETVKSFEKIFGVLETAVVESVLPTEVLFVPEPVIETTIEPVVEDLVPEEPVIDDMSRYLDARLYEAMPVNPKEPVLDASIAQVIKNLQLEISGLRNYVDARVRSIDTSGWGGGGGGAARVSDLDDVDVRTTALTENVTLSYDPIKRKWLPKTLEMLAEDLGPLIGGKLYAPYNRMIDVVGTRTYIGEATPGTAVNQVGWRIKMIEEFPTGDMSIIWADGSETFTLIWDDRLTYTYEVN